MKPLYLILENGKVFSGSSFGAEGEVTGEVVFTTSMTGYLETLTDPSYHGQIVVQTFPLIGNYGVIPSDFESSGVQVKAYIVREWCQDPSNFRCEGDLDTFLKSCGVVGLCGIDTRDLTRIVREHGVMNGKITHDPDAATVMEELKSYRIRNAVEATTAAEIRTGGSGRKVILWDFGMKENIRRELEKRGCEVTVVPAGISAETIIGMKPDGIMLSNGPGDPAENDGIIAELRKVNRACIPVFGICLGHQLLALSRGAKTTKLKYGHRGGNQPATEIKTGRTYITSQNHGYAVVTETLPKTAVESFRNANDGTNEGVEYLDSPAFSVQFHPEASAGPRDTSFLFDRFIELMEENKNAVAK